MANLQVCMWTLLICGSSLAAQLGQEFITAFMQNGEDAASDVILSLVITAYEEPTTVSISIPQTKAKEYLFNRKESKWIRIPSSTEMTGSGVFAASTITVRSDTPISVISQSRRLHSSGRAVVYPVAALGTEYYAITPYEEPQEPFKEFAIINHDQANTVDVYLKGRVLFHGQSYMAGDKLQVQMAPLEALQLQSADDLSGTRIVSEIPVAVLTGNKCSWLHSLCDLVYEQLMPVKSWGTEFFVPPLPFQSRYDVAYVVASQETTVSYTSGSTKMKREMLAGEALRIRVRFSHPLFITASAGIQVMFHCTGGLTQYKQYDQFLIGIPDTSQFCTSYSIYGSTKFINTALIVIKTSGIQGLRFDGRPIKAVQWYQFPDTNYSWGSYKYTLGQRAGSHRVTHPNLRFELLSFGIADQDGYGAQAICVM
ncbi:IgGFc-binding protein-like [Pleurodeles waltl]|uniref:IgGFc-binding protein-like n=1 Tax=Pleurodeles waltl TaxID=8319 RepID=UPI003709A034